jgi:hypothetical protein
MRRQRRLRLDGLHFTFFHSLAASFFSAASFLGSRSAFLPQ